MKFAVIQTGGRQYLVRPDDIIKIDPVRNIFFQTSLKTRSQESINGEVSNGVKKLEKPEKEGELFYFDKVLLVAGNDKIEIGKPFLENAKVSAEWQKKGRAKKISILRYKSKTRRRRKKGHRQIYTQVKIKEII